PVARHRDDDAIAPEALRLVHRLVRTPLEVLGRLARIPGRDADGHGLPDLQPRLDLQLLGGERLLDAVARRVGLDRSGLRHDEDELLAAPANEDVDAAD